MSTNRLGDLGWSADLADNLEPGLAPGRVTAAHRGAFDVRTADYYQEFTGSSVTYPIGDVYDYPLPGRTILLSVAWQPRDLAPAVANAHGAPGPE